MNGTGFEAVYIEMESGDTHITVLPVVAFDAGGFAQTFHPGGHLVRVDADTLPGKFFLVRPVGGV